MMRETSERMIRRLRQARAEVQGLFRANRPGAGRS